jgi:hypothetical protein
VIRKKIQKIAEVKRKLLEKNPEANAKMGLFKL